MVVYLHEALDERLRIGGPVTKADLEAAVIHGAVQRLRPKLMTVIAVLTSLVPILWESGIGSDVMKPIAAPIVGGMITSTIHVLILVPIFPGDHAACSAPTTLARDSGFGSSIYCSPGKSDFGRPGEIPAEHPGTPEDVTRQA